MRKYGLGADNVIDIRFMDKNGNIFTDKQSIGADVFWAVRGGIASNYGIVLAWQIKLVRVPATVTVFNVKRTLEQYATDLVHKYQTFAPDTDPNLFIRARITPENLNADGSQKTVAVYFQALYLGRASGVLKIMQTNFPELSLVKQDCLEMSWAKSALCNPRRSYVNYNDLDLGVGNGSFAEASTWGTRYFNNNFKRLVQLKNRMDAENFYLHEQSIPPFALT
ncbi:inactive tetrahydrocannabinolic acid synthase-like [Heracleum sosnowskyi]|uniref:Inactive tetrahydrocannabinolic acid synthase-like n=1 Tax=Heracleum sosnowskyi TaxID=360622 RepID=A0AAD8I7H7_9APIA|nr:inactive tetrahydrocannabinolic acid synthase-like [Heracleum sosnowskyi]